MKKRQIEKLVLMEEGTSEAKMKLWQEDGEEWSPYARMRDAKELP